MTIPMKAYVLTLAAMISESAPAVAKQIDKQFHHSFPATKGTVLHLVHQDGDVTVTPWLRDSIQVDIRYRASIQKIGWGEEPDFTVEFKQTGNTAHVLGRQTGGAAVGILNITHEDYRVTIQTPSSVALDFDGDDGEVSIADWKADVVLQVEDGHVTLRDVAASQIRIQFEDGRISLEGIRGDLFLHGEDGNVLIDDADIPKGDLRLEDGDITVKSVRGSLDVDLADGDLHMTRAELGNATVHTEDGDVDLDLLPAPELNLDVSTRDGGVHVELEPGTSVRFSAQTADGRIHVNLPGATDLEESPHHVSGAWNGSGGRLRVRTEDGPVEIRSRSGSR